MSVPARPLAPCRLAPKVEMLIAGLPLPGQVTMYLPGDSQEIVSLVLGESAAAIAARLSVPQSIAAPDTVVPAAAASVTCEDEVKLEIVVCNTAPETPAPPTMIDLPTSVNL